jgi:hypothetical protein
MTLRYAAIMKTHFWDAFAQRQLERLKRHVGQGDVFVVVNETDGPVADIGHPESRIIRVTEADAYEAGLGHASSHAMFWYSNDYQLHLMTRRFPDYDYYLLLEFDVVLGESVDVIVDRLHERGADFAGQPTGTPFAAWGWRATCDGVYAQSEALHWLICFMAFSRRAAHTLFERRLEMSRRLREGDMPNWPFSEAAVPTELYLAGLNLVRLDELGSIGHYDWGPPYAEEVLPDLTSTFIHPVLDARRFGTSVLRWTDETNFLSAANPLRGRYGPDALKYALPLLHDRFWLKQDFEHARLCLTMMREETDAAYRRHHGLDVGNIARGKPAWQSSLSEYSVCSTEACGAVTGVVNGSYKFHTGQEDRPWWMVDLGTVEEIGEILVFNRLSNPDRADGLEIFLSTDARNWSLAGRHEGPDSFGGADGNPLAIDARQPARFCRLEVPALAILHLDQVQIRRTSRPEPARVKRPRRERPPGHNVRPRRVEPI